VQLRDHGFDFIELAVWRVLRLLPALWTSSHWSCVGLTPPQPSVETSDPAILRGVILHSDMLTAISADQLWNEIASGDLMIAH
jgi:hypothetical protein